MKMQNNVSLCEKNIFCSRMFSQPEDSGDRSEVGTAQQLKDIPTETVSLTICRLQWIVRFLWVNLSRPLSRRLEAFPTKSEERWIFNGFNFLIFNHTVPSRTKKKRKKRENTRNMPSLKLIKPLLKCIDPEEMMQKETTPFPSFMSHTDKQCSC